MLHLMKPKDSSWESPLALPGTNHPPSRSERSSHSASPRLCLLMQKIKRDGGWDTSPPPAVFQNDPLGLETALLFKRQELGSPSPSRAGTAYSYAFLTLTAAEIACGLIRVLLGEHSFGSKEPHLADGL